MDLLTRLQPLIGLAGILALAYALSTNRRAISPRIVGWGLGLQVLFALIVIKTDVGIQAFSWLGDRIQRLEDRFPLEMSSLTEHWFSHYGSRLSAA